MEILEAKQNIRDLQNSLAELLRKFEEDTNTEAVDIFISRMDVTETDAEFSKSQITDVHVDVRLRVR